VYARALCGLICGLAPARDQNANVGARFAQRLGGCGIRRAMRIRQNAFATIRVDAECGGGKRHRRQQMRVLIFLGVATLVLSGTARAEQNDEPIKAAVKACVEAVNASGRGGHSDAYYNPAAHGVHISVATPIWTFEFDKCMAERGFPLNTR
jgi:hypothetical protein